MTENLWLNLSDGYIGSTSNWDGSGGTGAALKHFEEMQKEGNFIHYVLNWALLHQKALIYIVMPRMKMIW